MCKCLAGNVACCCFNCALSVLISLISAFMVVFIIVGALVYYFCYYEEDDEAIKLKKEIQRGIESNFEKIKEALSK